MTDKLTKLITAEVQIKNILEKLEDEIGETVCAVELKRDHDKLADVQLRVQTYSYTMGLTGL